MPAGTCSITFIHTNKKWDDVPSQLFMLHVCLISLHPLMMCLTCKYFKLSISCASTHQVLLYLLVNMLHPSSFLFIMSACVVRKV